MTADVPEVIDIKEVIMKKFLMGILLTVLLAAPIAAQADEPLETIKKNLDNVLSVLRDPAMQDKSAEVKKKEALRRISNEMFNWPLLSKRVLSKNWNALKPDQQEEFISLFKDILEQTYIDRILTYKDEQIEYAGNRMLSDKQAEVETHVLTGTAPIVLAYRLVLMDGKWAVYDVVVEGVAMTLTFRNQYRDYLQTKSPAELLDHLREKVGRPKA